MENNTNKHYRSLELDKILKRLSELTACDTARDMCLELNPSSDIGRVRVLLTETDDALTLSGRFGTPSFGGLQDVSGALRRAQAGASLNTTELLSAARVLHVLRTLKDWRTKSASVKTSLDFRFDRIIPHRFVEEKITSSILSEDEIADNASPELAAIRRKIRMKSSHARDQLDKMIRSSAVQKYLQDSLVTMREGRFVIPVKAEFRSNVAGLVHDTSSSGATVFIEPMSVVEANNEIKVLEAKEREEIDRILYSLSYELGTQADSIIDSVQAAIELNVIFAKAELAYKMKATMPEINDSGTIDLKNARHPLIDKNKVVPMSISLGVDFDTLVITGPNTGGKTVSLKLVGLLTLMAMCGLLVPAADGSKLSVFDKVFADIGDEQSIEQSLSTFSAHMTNTIDILANADNRSLVLLDELGAGTAPVEGAALATAILEEFRAKGARIACTTHYAELKAYALQTKGVENGSCEFDVATLRPTYRLLIGVPGRSNAFAVSMRLGMEKSIVDRAQELVSSDSRRFEEMLSELDSRRQKLEREVQQAQSAQRKADKERKAVQKELEEARRAAAQDAQRERQKSAELASSVSAQAYALLDELEALRKQSDVSQEDKTKLRTAIKNLEKTADPVTSVPAASDYVLPRRLRVGDEVLIFDIDKKATVLELPDNSDKVLVQAGIIRTRADLSNLRLVTDKKKQTTVTSSRRAVNRSNVEVKAVTEVDLRGMTAIEAIMELESAIDSAVLSNMNQITIIHGKGTGVLRTEVHKFLKTCKAVKSYRLGVYGEGEAGVTIAQL